MQVNITDNSQKVLSEFEKKVSLALRSIGFTAEKHAKDECPEDTGRLRNSISNSIKEKDVYIGTNVEYAPAVEFRDLVEHKTGKAHFLRDAATTHNDEYKEIALKELKD